MGSFRPDPLGSDGFVGPAPGALERPAFKPPRRDWTGADYQKAMFQRADLFRMVQKWFETADYVVTPTLSRTALPIEQDLFEPINIDGIEAGERHVRRAADAGRADRDLLLLRQLDHLLQVLGRQ